MLPDLLFLLFAFGLLLGTGLIIAARNPMVGMLGMLVTFLNASGMFILFGAEFLGLLLIMVYIGAIAVMFLFVLMTIDIDFLKLREGLTPYLPLGLLVVGVLAVELITAASLGFFTTATAAPITEHQDNIVTLGNILFTTYALPFQVAGLILLTAMVGAIVLTHHPRGDVKRQNISKQIHRERADSYTNTKPKVGQGLGADVAKHWHPKSVTQKIKN